ncbi:hypothetical protein GCM10010170_104840 [Dactylosporangium salmoneum]|uniref:Uncharacterized protein n=1 Tax=Dactylosporangium salmoneum TaxID=53361 RepID=A0ABN3I0X5_9ACTN
MATDQVHDSRSLTRTKVRALNVKDPSSVGGFDFSEEITPLRFDLPSPARARAFQESVAGRPSGDFDIMDNSCLTHCAKVLKAGEHPDFQGSDLENTNLLKSMIPGYGT